VEDRWSMGKLPEAATWPEEDERWLSMVSPSWTERWPVMSSLRERWPTA
jgi:hypothetical protein